MFDIFDENLKLLGQEKRLVVHTKGLFHQSTHVLVFKESNGSLLIQKRSSKKRIGPNLWDLSCAEHLQPGETQEKAAIRGLKEELNLDVSEERIKCIRDMKLFKRSYTYKQDKETRTFHDNEFIKCFRCSVTDDELKNLKKDDEEVTDIKFVPLETLAKDIKDNESSYTKWFLDEIAEGVLEKV